MFLLNQNELVHLPVINIKYRLFCTFAYDDSVRCSGCDHVDDGVLLYPQSSIIVAVAVTVPVAVTVTVPVAVTVPMAVAVTVAVAVPQVLMGTG